MNRRFVPWLLEQQGRNDAIGDLAEDTARVVKMGKLKANAGLASLRKAMGNECASGIAYEALDDAIQEKKKHDA